MTSSSFCFSVISSPFCLFSSSSCTARFCRTSSSCFSCISTAFIFENNFDRFSSNSLHFYLIDPAHAYLLLYSDISNKLLIVFLELRHLLQTHFSLSVSSSVLFLQPFDFVIFH